MIKQCSPLFGSAQTIQKLAHPFNRLVVSRLIVQRINRLELGTQNGTALPDLLQERLAMVNEKGGGGCQLFWFALNDQRQIE